MWAGSVLGNYYFNPGGTTLIALVIFVINFIVGIFITKILSAPLIPLFRALNKQDTKKEVIGSLCTIKLSPAENIMGQGEVEIEGAPLLINIKTQKGEKIDKGKKALVIMESKGKDFYIVEEFNEWE
jgi:ABC-type bacteriocin/lantibiotic exporter with double-glycine peptidase domain